VNVAKTAVSEPALIEPAVDEAGTIAALSARGLVVVAFDAGPAELKARFPDADLVQDQAALGETIGKPAAMIEKIVESGLKTFYKEVCLLDQPFIFDEKGKQSVAQAIKEAEAKAGAAIKVGGFKRFALGEGIDKPGGDFGGEVAALAGTH